MSLVTESGPPALRDLVDREAITELIHRYCHAVDRLDETLGYSIFHTGATADYGEFYVGSGHGAIDAICASHRGCLVHSHQITTTTIALDGDRAASEAYHTAVVRMAAGEALMQVTAWGRYLDCWSRRDGRWGMDHRQGVARHGRDQGGDAAHAGDDAARRRLPLLCDTRPTAGDGARSSSLTRRHRSDPKRSTQGRIAHVR